MASRQLTLNKPTKKFKMSQHINVSPEEASYRSTHYPVSTIPTTRLMCTRCDIIIKPRMVSDKNIHPVLEVLLCKKCRHVYDQRLSQKNNLLCQWCSNEIKVLFECNRCSAKFCEGCISKHFRLARTVFEEIKERKWQCCVCFPKPIWAQRAICAAAKCFADNSNNVLKERISKCNQRKTAQSNGSSIRNASMPKNNITQFGRNIGIPTLRMNIPASSVNVSASSINVSTSTVIRPASTVTRPTSYMPRLLASNVTQTGYNVIQPASNVTQPASNATQSASNVTQPSSSLTQSTCNVIQPASNVTQPASNVTQSASNVTQLASNLTQPASNMIQPEPNVTLRASNVIQTASNVTPPAFIVKQPSNMAAAASVELFKPHFVFNLQLEKKDSEIQDCQGSTDVCNEKNSSRAAESDQENCVICMQVPPIMVLYPCGHKCLCKQCSTLLSLRGKFCPLCRKEFRDVIRLYE